MTTVDDARLESMLRDAAAAAAWPATPDLRGAVVARISAPELRPAVARRIRQRTDAGTTPGHRGGDPEQWAATGRVAVGGPAARRPSSMALLRPLALALLLAIVLAGVAAALGFRLPAFDLERVERTPPAGAGLDLGSPVPVDEALAFAHPRVLLPAALPRPDTAFVLGAADRSIVTVAWRAAAGDTTLAGTDLSLSLMAVEGSVDEPLLTKLAGPGTTIEPVTVNGDRGWWIAGAPHEILIRGGDGTIGVLRSAVAGDTLVFGRGETLYRLESALGRDETLAVAASMR